LPNKTIGTEIGTSDFGLRELIQTGFPPTAKTRKKRKKMQSRLLTRAFASSRILLSTQRAARRRFNADSKLPANTAPPGDAIKRIEAPVVPKVVVEQPVREGSTFFQRLSSFLAGCGVGFGLTYYFLLTELQESNERFSRELNNLQNQISGK
jgi:hypothetical protein